MFNQKQTLEIGDRVLGHNGMTGYITAIDADRITIKTSRGAEFTSPRQKVYTTEAEPTRGTPVVRCVECGCELPSALSICNACGGF